MEAVMKKLFKIQFSTFVDVFEANLFFRFIEPRKSNDEWIDVNWSNFIWT